MQSSVSTERNGAGISAAYSRSMIWLPRIFTSMRWRSWLSNARKRSSNVAKLAASPVEGPSRTPVRGSTPSCSATSSTFGRLKYPVRMYASLPKAPTSTHPEHPPARASSSVLPCRSCSSTTTSALNSEGKPYPLRTTRSARLSRTSGVLRETCTLDEGCSRCISSTMSSSRCETSFDPSEPSASSPPMLMFAKSVYVPLSARRHAHLGRRGVVVELDEETLKELARRLRGERAVGQPLSVERQQVLVEVTGVEGVPPVELGDHAEVAEPVVLQRLVEVARRVGRHVAADGGDAFQFGPADRIGGLGDQLLGERGVPLGE